MTGAITCPDCRGIDYTPNCPTCAGLGTILVTSGPDPKSDPLAAEDPGEGSSAARGDIRRALDAKDALLRRCQQVLRAIRLVEPAIRPNAYHIELVGGVHMGVVSNLVVDIDTEFMVADPLEGR